MGFFSNIFGKKISIPSTKSSSDSLRIIHVIKKTNHLPEGIFANINNDLNECIRDSYFPILIKMAYAYARRTAAAGLFLQGVFNRENYNQASAIFKGMQIQTEQTVEFQEDAAKQASELLESYDKRLNKQAIVAITSMVENNQTPEVYGKNIIPYDVIINNIQVALKRHANSIQNEKSQQEAFNIAFERQVKQYGISHAAKRIAEELNERIDSRDLAMQFVLEELDAARQGDIKEAQSRPEF
jgi:vacuolar-type H+-ATPase subunit F/Vma7